MIADADGPSHISTAPLTEPVIISEELQGSFDDLVAETPAVAVAGAESATGAPTHPELRPADVSPMGFTAADLVAIDDVPDAADADFFGKPVSNAGDVNDVGSK